MREAQKPVFFDHYLASALGEWFATPDGLISFPLPYEVFLNLLTSGPIVCSRLDFFFYTNREDPYLKHSPRRKEFKKLIETGKIIIVDLDQHSVSDLEKDDKYMRVINKAREIQAQPSQLNRHRSAAVANVSNLAYCQSNDLPMRFSKETVAPAMMIVTECLKEGIISNKLGKNDPKGLNEILKWVFEVEVPFLDVKTEKYVDKLIEISLNSIYPLTTVMKVRLEKIMREDYYKDRVFIEAEELLAILKEEQALTALRVFLSRAAKHNPTAAETRELLRQEWDSMLGRLSISEWTFTGINVATSPLPFSGAVTALTQTGVNRYIKKQSSWLLTLNEFNKRVRRCPMPDRSC